MRLIDADELLKLIPPEEMCSRFVVANAPTIEPQRKTGKWIQFPNHMAYKCSECGRVIQTTDGQRNVSKHYPFCHCGADMRCESDDIPIEYFESGGI